jgi:hypothetical protein
VRVAIVVAILSVAWAFPTRADADPFSLHVTADVCDVRMMYGEPASCVSDAIALDLTLDTMQGRYWAPSYASYNGREDGTSPFLGVTSLVGTVLGESVQLADLGRGNSWLIERLLDPGYLAFTSATATYSMFLSGSYRLSVTRADGFGDTPVATNYRTIVPEPSTLALFALGGLAFARRHRQRSLP